MKRKIEAMHSAFGIDTTHKCKECCNFVQDRYHNKTLRKCLAYGLTHSAASDWAGRNTACGLFGKSFEAAGSVPMIELLKHSKRERDNTPLAGQCTLDEQEDL